MMKAGIVIDDYKMDSFDKALKEAGFVYTKHPGPVKGTMTLGVEFHSEHVGETELFKTKLTELVTKVNAQCNRGVN